MFRTKSNSKTRTARRRLTAIAAVLAAVSADLPSARGAASVPFVLVVYVSGGWDPAMVFDNKIGGGFVATEDGLTPAEGKGGIPYLDHASRPAVKTFFDTYGDHAAIINGVYVGSLDRRHAAALVLGAIPPDKARAVDFASFYAASLTPVMTMPHVVIDAPFLPGDYASVAVRVTSGDLDTIDAERPGGLSDDAEAALTAYRKTAYEGVYKKAASASLDGEKLRALYYGYAREEPTRQAFIKAKTKLGDLSADDSFVRAGKTAVELFAQGDSQCATVQAYGDGAWDTFENHHARQSELYEDLFAGLFKIFDYADARGILSKMTVLVVSDGGKSPQLNARDGKGPWPYTSVLVWGAGIRGGAVAGVSDKALVGRAVDPVFGTTDSADAVTLTVAHVWAAIFLKLDVATKFLLSDEVQPLTPILDPGKNQ
jgi:hypothetical protein